MVRKDNEHKKASGDDSRILNFTLFNRRAKRSNVVHHYVVPWELIDEGIIVSGSRRSFDKQLF